MSGGSVGLFEKLIEHRLSFEQPKVLAHLRDVQALSVGSEARTEIRQILGPPRSVDRSLQRAGDPPFGTDHAQFSERSRERPCARQQTPGDRAMRIEAIDSPVAAQIIGRIIAAMHATLAEPGQLRLDRIGVLEVHEHIDLLGRANRVVRGEREPPIRA